MGSEDVRVWRCGTIPPSQPDTPEPGDSWTGDIVLVEALAMIAIALIIALAMFLIFAKMQKRSQTNCRSKLKQMMCDWPQHSPNHNGLLLDGLLLEFKQ